MSESPPVEEFVVAAVAAACNLEKAVVTLDTDVLEVGLDSLHLLTLVGQVESTYGCTVTPEQVVGFFDAPCVRDVVRLVERIRAGRAIAGESG